MLGQNSILEAGLGVEVELSIFVTEDEHAFPRTGSGVYA